MPKRSAEQIVLDASVDFESFYGERRGWLCEMEGSILVGAIDCNVLEKLWKAAHALHPEGSKEAETFVRVRALRILRGQVSQVVKGLRLMVTKRKPKGTKQKTLLDVASYFYRNRTRMCYDHYLANGWPIASGSVEGACKNLVKDRMEQSGMRWTPPMAEAMLRLPALYLSGDFEVYWDFHVREDQRRLTRKSSGPSSENSHTHFSWVMTHGEASSSRSLTPWTARRSSCPTW